MSLNNAWATKAMSGWLCLALASGVNAADGPTPGRNKWRAWVELGSYAANNHANAQGEGALWVPLLQGRTSLLFSDLRGKVVDEDQHEGNVAIGYREMLQSGWNLGVWTGFDHRHTLAGATFSQLSVGVEALSQDWELRISGHVPFDDLKTVYSASTGPASQEVALYNGGLYLFTGPTSQTTVTEHAFRGVEADIGWRLPIERWCGANTGNFGSLRLHFGGYYFENNAFADTNIAGPHVRAEWQTNNIIPDFTESRLTLETSWQYDDARGHQIEAAARLRIPLGIIEIDTARSLTVQEERMAEGLQRYTDVVTRTKATVATTSSTAELVEDAVSGVDFSTAVIATNDTPNLQTVLTNAGRDALIIVQGGASNFSAVTMSPNQTILGGGEAMWVRGVNSGTLATYTAPGTRPTIGNDLSGSPAVTTANNAHLVGLHVAPNHGEYRLGIVVGANQQVFLDRVEISAPAIAVLVDASNSSLTVHDSYIHNSTDGVLISGFADSVSIDIANTQMMDVVYAFTFYGTNIHASIATTTFSGNYDYYLRFITTTTATLHDSIDNVDSASHKANYCYASDEHRFTGAINFTNGVSKNNADCTIW